MAEDIGSDLAMQVLGHCIKEVNWSPRIVRSCCSTLIKVDLHLENVHLDFHFGKLLLAACWYGQEEEDSSWNDDFLWACFSSFTFPLSCGSPGLI